MTTRTIRRLLKEAADEVASGELVPMDLQTRLAGAGYMLCQLDTDIQYILNRRDQDIAA